MKEEVINEIADDLTNLIDALVEASKAEVRPNRLILTGSRALKYHDIPITRPLGDIDLLIDCRDHKFNLKHDEFLQNLENLGYVTNYSKFMYGYFILNLTCVKTGKIFDIHVYYKIYNHGAISQMELAEAPNRQISSNWIINIVRPAHIIKKKLELIANYRNQPYFEDLINREKHLLDLLSIHLHELDQIAAIDFSKLEERPVEVSSMLPNKESDDDDDELENEEAPEGELFEAYQGNQPDIPTPVKEAKQADLSSEIKNQPWYEEAINSIPQQFYIMGSDGMVKPLSTGTGGTMNYAVSSFDLEEPKGASQYTLDDFKPKLNFKTKD